MPLTAAILSFNVRSAGGSVGDDVIESQRQNLAANTAGKGFGPQSPRNIESAGGVNQLVFGAAPAYNDMNLCNIYFHKKC